MKSGSIKHVPRIAGNDWRRAAQSPLKDCRHTAATLTARNTVLPTRCSIESFSDFADLMADTASLSRRDSTVRGIVQRQQNSVPTWGRSVATSAMPFVSIKVQLNSEPAGSST